ncbi:hypothetical protein OU997_16130 [Pseudomonas sp. SL4(2022)]|uniref:hypothetical protein n=1 Tax=Pseudomonas sp. SL4(2022) TaxID=2994661 RepID=UPI00226D8440|nr:hypothetical protein [Pseudomonas sp. SL4(2022)]WAC43763.1 hypothetical protein OU997_16130 [Pseudomonas sp. SL4(2022)]
MRVIVFTLAACLTFNAWAWETPEQAVAEYLKYDAAGYRLGGSDWKNYVKTYLDVSEFYDESGYDMMTVITSYAFSDPICRPTVCVSTVTYELLNTSNIQGQQIEKHPSGGFLKKTFTVTKTGSEWRLKSGMGNPFVLSDVYSTLIIERHGL